MNPKNENRKNEVFEYLKFKIENEGLSPTTEDICRALGMGKATVSKYVNRLIDEGSVSRKGRYALSLGGVGSECVRLPILGAVACGKPKLAKEDTEGYISVDRDIVGAGDFFALRASGESMKNVGISDGDIVYVRRQSYAEDGDIVVAMIEDSDTLDSEATLKRFFKDKERKGYILRPENENMRDIIVDEVKILGVAVRVLKKLV